MKKFLIITAAFILMTSASVYAAGNEGYLAVKGQVSYGFGDAHDFNIEGADVAINPGIGGGVIAGFMVNEQVAIEGNLSYEYWFVDIDAAGVDGEWTQFPLLVGVNYSVNPTTSIIGGLGITFWDWEIESDGTSAPEGTLTDDGSDLTLYVGAEFKITENFLLRPQFFYIDTDEDASTQIKVEAAYRF